MSEVSIEQLIQYKDQAEKKFKLYKKRCNFCWLFFLITNFFLFKYGLPHYMTITIEKNNTAYHINQGFAYFWTILVLIFVFVEKFYFEEKLKQQKSFYHNCVREIKQINQVASESIQEKERLEKKIKNIPLNATKKQKI